MRRLPIVPTVLVAIAVAAMVALGVWQLDRRAEKAAALARLTANVGGAPVGFPDARVGDAWLFRPSAIDCARVVSWTRQSGRSADGAPGWRVIAECATGTDGTIVPVQLGVARAPDATPAWRGGRVTGFVTYAPDSRPLLAGLFDRAPKRLMLAAATPPAGLRPNAPPDVASVPNNHLAYAVQWFLFAGIALAIYALALRRRAISST